MKPLLYTALLLGTLVSTTFAATYHVQKNDSSDANPCTAASPCLTLKRGSDVLSSGDTLVVHSGTYTNECLGDVDTADVSSIPPGTSWSVPTTVRANTGDTVTIVRTSQCSGGNAPINLGSTSSQYIVFDGINIRGNGLFTLISTGSSNGPITRIQFKNMIIEHGFIGFAGTIRESTFQNVTSRWMGYDPSFVHVCPDEPNGCHGFYLFGGDNDSQPHSAANLFTGVISHDNTGLGLTISCEGCGSRVEGNTIDKSLFYNNRSFGVLGYPGNTLKNSVIYNNYVGVGGWLNIYNNTVVDNNNINIPGDPANLGIFINGQSGQIVRNNIVLQHSSGDIFSNNSGATYSNNACGATSGTYGCSIATTAAANFVNAGSRNYALISSAPAINAGFNLAEVTNDFTGTPRSDGTNDIGAYEFVSGGPVPTSLVFVQQPAVLEFVGIAIAPALTVKVLDQFGVTYVATSISITVSKIGSGSGTLTGTLIRSSSTSTGLATFDDLTFTNDGTGTQIQAAASGLSSATSISFNTEDRIDTALVFTIQPSNTVSNLNISPSVKVSVLDQAGNLMETAITQITIAIKNNPSSGTLSCGVPTCIVTVTAGIATFTLAIDNVGSPYTLEATATNVASVPIAVESSQFIISGPTVPNGSLASLGFLTFR